MFVAVGGGATAIAAANYRVGTAMHMGPGYFPILVGAAVVGLGLIISGRALLVPGEAERVTAPNLRALGAVLLSVLAFALTLRSVGLAASVALLVVIARAALPWRWLELAALVVVLAAMAVAVFVFGLGMPLKIWP